MFKARGQFGHHAFPDSDSIFHLNSLFRLSKREGCREPPRYDTTLKWLGRVVHSVQTVRAESLPSRCRVVEVPGVGATEGAGGGGVGGVRATGPGTWWRGPLGAHWGLSGGLGGGGGCGVGCGGVEVEVGSGVKV